MPRGGPLGLGRDALVIEPAPDPQRVRGGGVARARGQRLEDVDLAGARVVPQEELVRDRERAREPLP